MRTVALLPCLLLALVIAFAQADAGAALASAQKALASGDYAEALRQAGIVAAESAPGSDQLRTAHSIAGTANVYQGNYADAVRRFQQALAIDRALDDIPGEVLHRNNLGGVYSFLGRYSEAHAEYQLALAKLRGSESQPWHVQNKQLSLSNLAILHQTLGQDTRALELYKELRALPIQQKPNVEAQILTNLAVVYRRLGDPGKALATYEQARRLFDRDPNAAALLYTLRNIGVVLARDLDRPEEALRTFRDALKLAERGGNRREMVQEHLFLGETLLRMGRLQAAEEEFQNAAADAEQLKLVDEQWTALAGLGRTRARLGRTPEAAAELEQAISVIESSRANLTTSLREEFLAAKRDVYDALIALMLDRADPPVADILVRMEQGRARNLKDARTAGGAPATIESIQKRLDPQTAFLEYWMSGDRLAVVWITQRSSGIWQKQLSPPDAAGLDSLARGLTDKNRTQWRALATSLSPLIVPASLKESMPSISKLVIAADGPLSAIPFEVLDSGGSTPLLLVERYGISYVPSEKFLRAQAPRKWRWPWRTTLTAFADPIVPISSAPTEELDQMWPRLPNSAKEARAVAAALPGGAELFIGDQNLKQTFLLSANGNVPILHLATHAAVDLRDSRRSRLVFTPAAGQAATQYLFRDEIAALSLSGVELVTLAACESEQGRYLRGEGLEGFSRVFLSAGAASAVGSLWRVSDQATAEFMKRFYSHLATGTTKAEALRLTKQELFRSNGPLAHPYYWAAFVITGDGHNVIPWVVPWWMIALPVALCLLSAVWLWRRYSL